MQKKKLFGATKTKKQPNKQTNHTTKHSQPTKTQTKSSTNTRTTKVQHDNGLGSAIKHVVAANTGDANALIKSKADHARLLKQRKATVCKLIHPDFDAAREKEYAYHGEGCWKRRVSGKASRTQHVKQHGAIHLKDRLKQERSNLMKVGEGLQDYQTINEKHARSIDEQTRSLWRHYMQSTSIEGQNSFSKTIKETFNSKPEQLTACIAAIDDIDAMLLALSRVG